MRSMRGALAKFVTFAALMVALTVGLVVVFGQYQTGSTTPYSAVFADSSGLRSGDTVRVAGIRVGTVRAVSLSPDLRSQVTFDADDSVRLTTGTQVAVRYLNLVGDRYLELVDGPGSTRLLPRGAQIPTDRTSPALDLDLLLGGFKPVIQGLNPHDVNELTGALLQILQGQGGTLDSLLSKTSSFSNSLADNDQLIGQLIDSLRSVLATLSKNGDQFSATIDRADRLVAELAGYKDPIGSAITALDNGTASVADLLTRSRTPLAGTVDQLARLAPLLEQDKDRIELGLQKAPSNFRKLARLGSYGSFFQFYLCGITLKLSTPSGRDVTLPFVKQTTGRCAHA
jgi:phospholipid/cholesterol/gamma-HCH transport system substrate-binding protein